MPRKWALMDGKEELNPYFCVHHSANGSSHMSRATGSDESASGVVFGSTNGATGMWSSGPIMPLPTADGKLAGCRSSTNSVAPAS